MNIQNDEVMVTVICLTYNHEKFIRKTLEGFVMQNTTFPFEVLVHDDASTDSTASIVREYENKHPDIIHAIYQNENQYSKRTPLLKNYILPIAKGKYLAWCEGDDYWTDPNKLQKQVDALENHSECIACFCKVQYVSYSGSLRNRIMPYLDNEEGVLNSEEYLSYTLFPGIDHSLPWQLSGLLMRRDVYCDYYYYPPEYKNEYSKIRVGDIPLFLYIGQRGSVYYIDSCMSCYRSGNPDSFVGRSESDIDGRVAYYQIRADALEHFDRVTNYEFHDAVIKGIKSFKYLSAVKKNDIKLFKSEDLIEYYIQFPIKQKLFLYIYNYCPFVLVIYKRFKRVFGWKNRKE